MARETRTSKTKVETQVAPSLLKKFKKYCKNHGLSMAQRLRDLIQADTKVKKW